MAGFLSLFRSPSVRQSSSSPETKSTSSPPLGESRTTKRKRSASPEPNERSADVVAQRWKQLENGAASTEQSQPQPSVQGGYSMWLTRFKKLGLNRKVAENGQSHSKMSMDIDDDDGNEADRSASSDTTPMSGGETETHYPYGVPPTPVEPKLNTQSMSFQAMSLDRNAMSMGPLVDDDDCPTDVIPEEEDEDEDGRKEARVVEDDDDSDDDDYLDENEDWGDYFQPDHDHDDDGEDSDDESDWEVDEEELQAYNEGVSNVEGYSTWLLDEVKLHRLLSLRGFHPLMPATWTRDFLGVPMYPSLFAPADSEKSVVITNKGSQFRATKAMRCLFDLQARITGLRQTGNTARIGFIIEKELRRYIAWAQQDAGLDHCGPLAAMPNIAAKRFSPTADRPGAVEAASEVLLVVSRDFFRKWASDYRAYYLNLPEFPTTDGSGETRRLRPPRLLYGFVIVQHAAMLLAVDTARPRARPRCFADFNMSLGDHWLDASLNVAVPVHFARTSQLRSIEGLQLPVREESETDEDA